jgi:hypothetical protein
MIALVPMCVIAWYPYLILNILGTYLLNLQFITKIACPFLSKGTTQLEFSLKSSSCLHRVFTLSLGLFGQGPQSKEVL